MNTTDRSSEEVAPARPRQSLLDEIFDATGTGVRLLICSAAGSSSPSQAMAR